MAITPFDPGPSRYASFDDAFAQFSQLPPPDPEVNNILAALNPQSQATPAAPPGPPQDLLAGTPYGAPADPAMQNQQQPAAPAREPRQRASLLDIIGGVADTVASVGGADPLYRMNLDAAAERARQVDLDEMQRQQFEQQQKLGGQQLQAGELDIANDERARIGDALAAVAQSEDPAGMWGTIAEQSGIPPDKAAAIGAALQQQPEIAGALAQSFGYAPQAQGSQPKEVQIYRMLQQENPDLAPAYLQSLTNPGGMNEYQRGQLQIALGRLGLERDRFEQGPPQSASERRDATQRQSQLESALQGFDLAGQSISDLRDTLEQMREVGSINTRGQSGLDRIGAFANENIPLYERVLNPEGFSARERMNTIVNNMVLETLPLITMTQLGGRNFDAAKELEFHKQRIASAKDFEAAMSEVDALERKINTFKRMAQTELQQPAPAANRRTTPAPRGQGRSTVGAPQPGTVRRGWRFKGGDPANRSNWEKVN